jgi:hypothetical protein
MPSNIRKHFHLHWSLQKTGASEKVKDAYDTVQTGDLELCEDKEQRNAEPTECESIKSDGPPISLFLFRVVHVGLFLSGSVRKALLASLFQG